MNMRALVKKDSAYFLKLFQPHSVTIYMRLTSCVKSLDFLRAASLTV